MRLFVYGSLKRGEKHHERLRGSERERAASTEPGYRLVLQGRYPALARGGGGVVWGEVFVVSQSLIAELDEFEDVPTLYQRAEIRLDDGSVAGAYVIDEASAAECPEIPSGGWP